MFRDTPAYSGFAVDDIDKAREFYADTLGVRSSRTSRWASSTLDLAGDRPTLVYPKPDFVPATYTILNFEVDDIDAAVDELTRTRRRASSATRASTRTRGIMRGDGPDIAWFTDPAGNILAVLKQGWTARPRRRARLRWQRAAGSARAVVICCAAAGLSIAPAAARPPSRRRAPARPATSLSLITAITAAKRRGGADTVALVRAHLRPERSTRQLVWPNGLPPIASDITIEGSGAKIMRDEAAGTPSFRFFFVGAT